MRCFVAVELPDHVLRPLQALLAAAPRGPDVRWCTPDQLHVTLKFLGEVEDDRLPRVQQTVADAAQQVAPFVLRLNALGAFPSPRSPRVLWCGMDDPAGGCARWVSIADPLFESLGFEREQRAFTPHVTLARSRSPRGARLLRGALERLKPPEPIEMPVTHMTLFESRLSPHGAQYTPVHRAPLGD